ncbi:MAG: AraC family transcriptional regulator [bacterium]|nr:AraC family transcriptional regulator [bacterium]
MLSYETNVLAGSDYYLYTSSALAKKLFFYPVCTGYFYYAPGYQLRRANYDSFLVMLIKQGECLIKIGDHLTVVPKGSVVLLDCYAPNQYETKKGYEAIWLHFDGPLCRSYYEQITKSFGNVLLPRNSQVVEQILHNIYNTFRNSDQIKEENISRDINDIMTELLFSNSIKDVIVKTQQSLSNTISYINEHFTENISLKQLAEEASLSPFYFTRMFAKETGMTPHQYLIAARINCAKFLLKTTALSIKEIAFNSGFSDESNFCTTFKKWELVTPSEYRSPLG